MDAGAWLRKQMKEKGKSWLLKKEGGEDILQHQAMLDLAAASTTPPPPSAVPLTSEEAASDYIKQLSNPSFIPSDVTYGGQDYSWVPIESTGSISGPLSDLYNLWIQRGVKAKVKPVNKR